MHAVVKSPSSPLPRASSANGITTLALVFSCFTFSSSAYLAWLYHLMLFVPPESVDVLSMGGGYACQGIGLGLALAIMRFRPGMGERTAFIVFVALHLACSASASLSDNLVGTLAFGYTMNALCGIISAYYLLRLASLVREERRGIVFGVGYACSVLASWLLTMVNLPLNGVPAELVSCALFSAIAVVIALTAQPTLSAIISRPVAALGADDRHQDSAPSSMSDNRREWGILAIAGMTVLLMSMVKNMGFNFPAEDIGSSVSLEFSRLLYAVGLVVAGVIIDRNRKMGGLLCMAALAVPFAMMALSSEPVPRSVMWAIAYFFQGFFSVFRVIIFADLAMQDGRIYLAGFGFMIGRFGDALGTIMSVSLGSSVIVLITVTAALFGATVIVFYQLFQQMYQAAPVQMKSEHEVFDAFAARHELSPREREVLRLLLDEHTNSEMASILFISENTVKFHMRNVLKKTGTKNRVELLAKYAEERSASDDVR